jgi:ribosomal protein S7
MPHVEVRSRRVGGANFQIPMPIRADRKISMAMKWLISYSKKRNDKSMALKLANEVVAASREEGAAFKKKTDTHKMAEANKAFHTLNSNLKWVEILNLQEILVLLLTLMQVKLPLQKGFYSIQV